MSTETISLRSAVLCVECEAISRGRNNQCEVCGSRALLNLWTILNRDSAPVSKPQHVPMPIGVA